MRRAEITLEGRTMPVDAALVEGPARRLFAALAQDDEATAIAAGERLAGLGPGLTPAGDDVILGAAYALWATSAEGARLAARLISVALPVTTPTSVTWLEAAARGESAGPWLALLAVLAAGDSVSIASAAAEVERWGATSGRVSLASFSAVSAARRGRGHEPIMSRRENR